MALLGAATGVGAQAGGSPGVVPPNAHALGRSYSEWSAAWWQWDISLPVPNNPTFDPPGVGCDVAQSGRVFFLAGSASSAAATRQCTVHVGTPLLIPVVTVECSTVEPPPFFGGDEAALRACAAGWIDRVIPDSLRATLDGAPVRDLTSFRVRSPVFSFVAPANNLLGVPGPITGRAVADGYWLVLHPCRLAPTRSTWRPWSRPRRPIRRRASRRT